MSLYLFFFVKQKTAYEMRISDWSSDVCSSDLDTVVDVDQLLRAEVRDAVLDLDAPVVDRDVHPVGRIPHHADRVLGRLFRTQAFGLFAVGVDLVAASRVARVDVGLAVEGAGSRIDHRVGRERRFLGDDVQGRGDEALAHRTTQGQALERMPGQGEIG